MKLEVVGKLVSVVDGSVIGYLTSAGGQYTVAVTLEFVDSHKLDIDCREYIQFVDVPSYDVVPCDRKQYAMVERSLGYSEELKEIPSEALGDSTAYFGYIFKPQHIVPLDSEFAYDRMLKEAFGEVVD